MVGSIKVFHAGIDPDFLYLYRKRHLAQYPIIVIGFFVLEGVGFFQIK